MVELFWKLVLKINARAVFLFTVLLLCVTLVVLSRWGARQGAHLSMAGHPIPVGPAAEAQKAEEDVRVPVREMEDPFTSAFLIAWLDLEENRRREAEASRAAKAQDAKPREPEPAPAPAPVAAPPPPKWVSVKYQGMIARTDGTRVALVLEPETGTVHTLAEGDAWQGRRVKTVAADRMVLEAAGGDEQALKVGVVSRVRKGGA